MDAGRKTLQGIDRYRYRTIVKNSVKKDNIKHITSQELAYLLKYIDMKKTVVTCFDLIPWAFEQESFKNLDRYHGWSRKG